MERRGTHRPDPMNTQLPPDGSTQQPRQVHQQPDFNNYMLLLPTIEKTMDDAACTASSETVMVFAKSCEMLIRELTSRAWSYAEENKRTTLDKCDVDAAIASADIFVPCVGSKDNNVVDGGGVMPPPSPPPSADA